MSSLTDPTDRVLGTCPVCRKPWSGCRCFLLPAAPHEPAPDRCPICGLCYFECPCPDPYAPPSG